MNLEREFGTAVSAIPDSNDAYAETSTSESPALSVVDRCAVFGPMDWWPRIPLARRFRAVTASLIVSDAGCATLALLLAHVLLVGWVAPPPELLGLMAIVPIAWVASFHAFGLYNVRYLSAVEEFRRLIGATCVATSLVTLVRAWSNIPPYRKWLVLTWLLALSLELVVRRVWRWQLARLRRTGRLASRTVILGANEEAHHVGRILRDPILGFDVVGYLTTHRDPCSPYGLAVVGHIDDLDRVIRGFGVECVFVSSSAVTVEDMAQVAGVARRTDVEMRVSANLSEILTSRLSVQRVGDLLSLAVRPVRMSPVQAALKRSFDVCLASLAVLATLPLMAVVALAVRLSSPGPILFRQERVTRHGQRFAMLKFRTMVEPRPDEREIDLTSPFFKLPGDDPRLTAVGRFLRRFSLDELPQLYQVVTGKLSLVGPRPLPAEQVAAYEELMSPRHEVRAGITGWWQVNGRSSVDAEEALRLDRFYIENWSLSLDLFIVLRTVGTVLSRRGAC